jgi:hypothetical protein
VTTGTGVLNGSRNAIVVAVVSAILGSTGGPFLLVKLGVNPYREDAYTSSMADQHEEVDGRRFEALERHVRNHPSETGKFENRIATLEAQNALILIQLDRIINRLDNN